MQLGCGLAVKEIHGRRYLYFWAYEGRSWGSQRNWRYVGPVGRVSTRAHAAELLITYHLRLRKEVDRRIAHLESVYVATR